MGGELRVRLGAVVVAAALLATGAVDVAEAKAHRQGEQVIFQGIVTDSEGNALEGVHVVFEATRRSFNITRARRDEKGLVRRSARSSADGTYRFEWDWHSFYNRFRLKIVDGVDLPSTEARFETITLLEVEKSATKGNLIDTALVVRDAEFVEEHREFVALVETDDETRIYEQNGKPDRVERIRRDGFDETSWWYFEQGKAYRFRYGKLSGVEEFNPISPI